METHFATRNELERALRDYDEAIRLDPHYAHAFNNRGLFLERGEAIRAIRDFNRAIAEDTSYANAFRNRGLARLQQQSFDLAIADFDEAFRLNPAIGHGIEYATALSGRDAVPSPIDDSDDRDGTIVRAACSAVRGR